MPARLDRLPWSRFHWLVVVALGITWILDGLEVTLAGSVASALREPGSLGFSASDVGFANSAYLAGAVIGALFFGWLTDRMGRKRMFTVTLGLYSEIERRVEAEGHVLPPVPERAVRLQSRRSTSLGEVALTLLRTYPRRTFYGLSLMVAQAFFYNAIFFTYAMMLTDFYDVPGADVGWYILPFAAGNVLGPLLLGRLFDTIGRRPMIMLTYGLSGVLLLLSGLAFRSGLLDATTQTLFWSVTFFFASAAASAAYLTVAESFPLEVRALAIAIFYAVGTGLGGVAAPWLFGTLIESGSRDQVLIGYVLGSGLMIIAAVLTKVIGIDSERKALEDVAKPLSWG